MTLSPGTLAEMQRQTAALERIAAAAEALILLMVDEEQTEEHGLGSLTDLAGRPI